MSRDDRGSIAPMIPILMFALLLLGGLVVDGSRTLNARGDARAYAEEAARAGATAIRKGALHQQLNFTTARQRVADYCKAVEVNTHGNQQIDCHIEPDPDKAFTYAETCDKTRQRIVVHVVASVRTDTTLLGMAGFTHFTMTADASARPFEQTFNPDQPYC